MAIYVDILLVEDSEFVRREIVALLEELPVVDEVVQRPGIAEAREALEERDFGLWVLDFQLEDGTALDLLRERRRASEPERSEVMIVTNHATPLVRNRCLQAGADHFFDKTAELDEMLAVVEAMADRSDAS